MSEVLNTHAERALYLYNSNTLFEYLQERDITAKITFDYREPQKSDVTLYDFDDCVYIPDPESQHEVFLRYDPETMQVRAELLSTIDFVSELTKQFIFQEITDLNVMRPESPKVLEQAYGTCFWNPGQYDEIPFPPNLVTLSFSKGEKPHANSG